MSHPVISIRSQELVTTLAHLLLETSHGGFPVCRRGKDNEDHFFGLITRSGGWEGGGGDTPYIIRQEMCLV